MYKEVSFILDWYVTKGVIHTNTAANKKSKLSKHVLKVSDSTMGLLFPFFSLLVLSWIDTMLAQSDASWPVPARRDTFIVAGNAPTTMKVTTIEGVVEGVLHSASREGVRIIIAGERNQVIPPEEIIRIEFSEHGSFWWPLLHGYSVTLTAAAFEFSLNNRANDQGQAFGIALIGGFIGGTVGLVAAVANMIVRWPRKWNVQRDRRTYFTILRRLQEFSLWHTIEKGYDGRYRVVDFEEEEFDPTPPSYALYYEYGLIDGWARLMSYSLSRALSKPFDTILSSYSRVHGTIGVSAGIEHVALPISIGLLFGKSYMFEVQAGALVNLHTSTGSAHDERFRLDPVTGMCSIGYRYQSTERIFRVSLSPRFSHVVLPNLSISYGWSW